MRRSLRRLQVLSIILAVAGCAGVEEIGDFLFDRTTPRERYEARLEYAGLTGTALGRDWLAAADRALREAPAVSAPWVEEGYLSPAEPAALAFRISARRGQRITFDLDIAADSSALVFIDAWQIESDTAISFRHIESADSGVRSIEFEPRRDGDYIVRVQPELLRGGRFTATLSTDPTLAFPVQGAGQSDIGSIFGDPRDGGVRNHHGIDIFAPRGTPVLAAAEATVSRVQETPRGGRVVWLRDRQGHSLYYAHLDSQAVSAGQAVQIGDVVGFVGNTGNARTTPPHLHFGVYSRGPVNPYWFVHSPSATRLRLTADTSLLGDWARTSGTTTTLRASPDERAIAVAELPRHTALRVVGAAGSWFRVRLPDGAIGYIAARGAEAADDPVSSASLDASASVFAAPAGIVMAEVRRGDVVPVLGRFGDYLLVRGPDGRDGWLMQQ